MSELFSRAEDFIWRNARTIERRLFAFHFKGGSGQAVLDALRAYQNADGGFGHALEPDIRSPDSQPVPTQHALEVADAVGMAPVIAGEVCGFLQAITRPDGGVPFVLPSVRSYPRAPWWETADDPPGSLNPTAMLAGLLHKSGSRHAWLAVADAFCRPRIEAWVPDEPHALSCVLGYLEHAPDRTWADAQLGRIGAAMLESGLVAEPGAEGYVRDALDWAPTPQHPLRGLFPQPTIDACIQARVARQGDDGGWPIAWPPPSVAAEYEWRGWVTLSALVTLRANGAL